jgi:hypothetical protein
VPEIGDKVRGVLIGKTGTQRSEMYQWAHCAECHATRWVKVLHGAPISQLCRPCAMRQTGKTFRGAAKANWKGGRRQNRQGYILVYVQKDDFWASMARFSRGSPGGYALEHRLVMAKHLGRNLWDWEVVHHKNGIKDDNRIENLELSTNAAHITDHHKGYMDGYRKGITDGRSQAIASLQARVTALEAEVTLLRGSIQGSEIYNKET